MHYHAGLSAGENTLNAQLLRVLLRTVAASDAEAGYSPTEWLEAYAKFMTTPGSHNDSYADTAHVQFFYQYSRGTPLEKCSGDENHSTANIGALYALVVLLLASTPRAVAAHITNGAAAGVTELLLGEVLVGAVQRHVALTHASPKLLRYAGLVATLILELLSGVPLRTAVDTTAKELGIGNLDQLARVPPQVKEGGQTALLPAAFSDLPVVQKGFGLSCYVHDSLPAVLFLAYKYSEPGQVKTALLTNANVGGKNIGDLSIAGMHRQLIAAC